ncbi:hypothetical protein HN358_03030 [Candidatus Uhrbacteria bacterium]|nr:hypothetical protein [Candidatus Uhrbacteria bacterium]MBT7717174.1 hypothetical protein [Candidatus Uhrbacteria bacterium]
MNDKADVIMCAHQGTFMVYPHPEGRLAHLYEEVTVNIRGNDFVKPKVWILGASWADTILGTHGTRQEVDTLKRLMRSEGIVYQVTQDEMVPCCQPARKNNEWVWYDSDRAQLRTDSPLAIFFSG